MEETIRINEVATILNVSVATVRNWIKNGTIKSDDLKNFIKKDILKLKKDLESGENGRLQSRRNKTKIKGNKLSKKYIESKNGYEIASNILDTIDSELTTQENRIILAEYCLKLLANKNNEKFDICLLSIDHFNKQSPAVKIVLDLLKNNVDVNQFIEGHKNSFIFQPTYNSDDFIGLLWMGLKSLNDRKSGGVYFTPTNIVEAMIKNIVEFKNKTIIDPCCGSGNFLLASLKNGFNYQNIYGLDVDDVSVNLARFNIALNAEDADYDIICKNIKCTDSLRFDERKFDICIGNPPWGSDIDCNDLFLRMNFECLSKEKVDAFDLFLEKGIKMLNNEGILFLVVPEALMTVGSHGDIRNFLYSNSKLKSVIYWGNAFDGVQAPAISIMLENKKVDNFEIGALIVKNDANYKILSNRNLKNNIWSLNLNDCEFSIIEKIKNNKDCRFLENNADFALGIVTGDNTKYVLSYRTNNSSELVKGSDIYKYKLDKGNYFIEFNPDLFQQVAKKEYYYAKEKLIYRFISDTLVFAYDDKQTLSLNSANIVIPHVNGLKNKYILAVLNSSFAHFYFKKIYSSIKILRNHIESIPIPYADTITQDKIIELVCKIENENDKDKIEQIYNQIDDLVMDLFKLSDFEKSVILENKPQNLFLF